MSPAKWADFCWSVLGLLALMLGVMVLWNVAEHNVPLWLCADQYVAAELEVTRFETGGRKLRTWANIEGVIHPGGEQMLLTGRDNQLDIHPFVDPNDRTGRRVPLPSEIEGKRLAVCYWPDHAGVMRSWHPPTVLMPERVARASEALVQNVLIGGACVGVAGYSFRRVYRAIQLAAPPEPKPTGPDPNGWLLTLGLMVLYLGILGLVAYLLSP